MTEQQFLIYTKTVRRLARMDIHDPTAQIIALAEEIEQYRANILKLEEKLKETPAAPTPITSFPKHRYTLYEPSLGRFVVPLHYAEHDDSILFCVGMTSRRYPDSVFGQVIDKLAELEDREEEQNHGPTV